MIPDIVARWVGRAMKIDEFLEARHNVAEIVQEGLIRVEARVDEGDVTLG
jgi:hypothetical protein